MRIWQRVAGRGVSPGAAGPRTAAGTAWALIVYTATLAAGLGVVVPPPGAASSWVMLYVAGVGLLLARTWFPALRLTVAQSIMLLSYALLLGLIFWGANEALDLLGNSITVRRLPPERRPVVPLHAVLAPGVASLGLGALAAALSERFRLAHRPHANGGGVHTRAVTSPPLGDDAIVGAQGDSDER